MIDHVTIYVNDLTKSKAFYEKAFSVFGYKVSFGEKEKFWAFDVGNGSLFEIAQHKDTRILTPCHIAFRAKATNKFTNFMKWL